MKLHTLTVQISVFVLLILALIKASILYPSTEMALVLLVVLAIIVPKARAFVIDFAPFIILLFSYDTLRNFADDLSRVDVHVRDLIRWEHNLFGGALPGYWLQQNLWNRSFTPLLDMLTNALYLSHFMTPLIAAVALWRHRKSDYWAFAFGLVAMSFAGFATFMLFPAAPPWWATSHGFLANTPITLNHFVISAEVVSAGPNPVAAMPSLHTAYPTYIALVCLAVWGRKVWPVVFLPMGVAFSTFYLGHHWVIDAMGGAAYAFVSFITVFLWFRRREISLSWLNRRKEELSSTGVSRRGI